MNKKLLSIMLVIIVSITLIGVTALVVVMKFMGEDEQKVPTAKEIVEASVDIPEITTNISSGNIVRLSFKIETDSTKAKEELAQREFQVRDLIISELANMTADDLNGNEGMNKLKESIKEKTNKLMQEGKVNKVYTTSYILQ